MKTILAGLLVFLGTLNLFAATLIWDDPNPAGTVTRYAIYRQAGSTWVRIAEAVDKRWPIVLPPGQYTLAVTAIAEVDGAQLESDRSESKTFLIPVIVLNIRIEQ